MVNLTLKEATWRLSVKVGDLVKDNHPNRGLGAERIGLLIERTLLGSVGPLNKSFKVLWRDGTIGNNVWDYDLKIVKSS